MSITYSIAGGPDAAEFNIDGSTGVLTFKIAPDYENPADANKDNIYEVTVKATDVAGASSVQDMQVTVKDVSENLPPQITSAAAVAVNENQTAVTTVTATDPDQTPPPGGGGTSGFPTEAGTGVPAGTTLTKMNASKITAANTVLTGKDIAGNFVIANTANGTRIENCRITITGSSAYAGIEIAASNCTIKNCEIVGPGVGGAANFEGIRTYSSPVTIDGVKIRECGHAIALDGNCTIKNCYMYNYNCGSGTHVDGIISTNCAGATITNNTIDLRVASENLTSAIWLSTVNANNSIKNITADANQLIYGGYTVRADDTRGGPISGIAFTNNALGKGAYDYKLFDTRVPVTFTGNYDYLTNVPIP